MKVEMSHRIGATIKIWLFGICLLPLTGFAGIPLPDFVIFGRVYTKTTQTQITGTLPGPITVKINSATGPTDPVMAASESLLDSNGSDQGVREFYVIRMRRFEAGTSRGTTDTFVMPGDRIHVYLNGVEVTETEATSILVTDAPSDVRLLSLNAPPNPDSDGDGIPDDWELQYFGNLLSGANEDPNKDGVSNFFAYVMGLNPNSNNASRMPTTQIETGGNLVFYFRQSTMATGLTYIVESSDALIGNSWLPIPGLTPTVMGTEGTSRILKVTIPGGVDRPRRFFRLGVSQ